MSNEEIIQDVKKKLGFDIEGLDIRSEIQREWLAAPFYFFKVINWATSVSKTLPALKKIESKKTLIVTSQTFHQKNWKKEAIKWNVGLSTCTFCCYNSLHKYIGTWELIILDECQRFPDSWSELLPQFGFNELLMLSGTITTDTKKKMYNIGKPQFSTITPEMAVEFGILSEPEINVIWLTLDNVNRNQIFIKGKDKKKKTVICEYWEYQKTYKWLKSDKRPNLHIKCTEQEWLGLHEELMGWVKDQAIKTGSEILWTRLKLMGNERKSFLAKLKTKPVLRLMDKLKEERLVIFASDIEQAMIFDKDAVHSKNKNGQQIIDEFNEYKRDKIVSVRQLQEAMNLVEPDNGIIVQLDNSKEGGKGVVNIKSGQALGRIFRSDVPKLYLFVFKNTQDEVYYNSFKESLDSKWFHNIKLNEI
jgi:superfamily II DNA or RNA helicase